MTSFVLGQDRFSWTQLAAIVLICASVYLVEVAESKSENRLYRNPDKTADKECQNETIVLPGLLHISLSVNSVDK